MTPQRFLSIRYHGRTFFAPESPLDHLQAVFGRDDPPLVSGFPSVQALVDFLFSSAPDVASNGEDVDLDRIERWTVGERVQEVDATELDAFNCFMAEVFSLLPEQAAKRAHSAIEQALEACAPLLSIIIDTKAAYYLGLYRDVEECACDDQGKRRVRIDRRPPPFWGAPPEQLGSVMNDDRMKTYLGKLIGQFGELVGC